MLKTLAAQIKQYKKSTILTPIFAALEVVMEVLIPMAMALRAATPARFTAMAS